MSGRMKRISDNLMCYKEIFPLYDIDYKDLHRIIHDVEKIKLHPHVNVIKTYGIYFGVDCNFFIKEFCHMNLRDGICDKKFSNEQKMMIVYQIAEGMKHLCSLDVFVISLRPNKILLLKNGVVKISGFDSIYPLSNDPPSGFLGFVAPECFDEEYKLDSRSAVYSFGHLVYYILSGRYPEFRKRVDTSALNNSARNFLEKCLNHDPDERPSFDDILEMLNKLHYGLLDLNESEYKNVESFVKQHKMAISSK